jgi:hypothetical protein
MNYVPENKRLSLTACKKILNAKGVLYTDKEVIEIRDWLYHMMEIMFDANDREESAKNEAARRVK